jgi:hypothetical protein
MSLMGQNPNAPERSYASTSCGHPSHRLWPASCHERLMQCSKEHPYWMALEACTILGSRIVKVEPLPGSLATVISPPII